MGVRGEPPCPAAVSSPSVSPFLPPATHVPCLSHRNCACRKHENSIIAIYIFIHLDIIKPIHIYAVRLKRNCMVDFFCILQETPFCPFSHQDKQNLAVNFAGWLNPSPGSYCRLTPAASSCPPPARRQGNKTQSSSALPLQGQWAESCHAKPC